MNLFQALIFSFIQSATEFLPISSSGHLLLLKALIHLDDAPMVYDIVVHCGSLIAVCVFFFSRIRQTISGSFNEIQSHRPKKPHTRFLLYAAVSTGVTFIGYLLFNDFIEAAFNDVSILPITYFITSCFLLATLWIGRGKDKPVVEKPWFFAIIVGLVQILAMLPGVSRSGSTIAIMLILGTRRSEAAYFSFILFIPAVIGAMIFQLTDQSMLKYMQGHWMMLVLAFLMTTGFSTLFLFFLTWIVKHGRLWIFAGYTIVVSFIAWVLF